MSDLTTQPPLPSRRAEYLWFAALMIFVLLLVLTLYTLLHEGGHALMGLLFGGTINGFNVNFFNLSAHVGIDGTFTLVQRALISAAGVSLPVLLCMAFIALTAQKRDPILSWFKIILFMATVNAMLAWITIPVMVLSGQTVSDDSANFLNITHLPPLLVTGVALVIYLACWALFINRMGGLRAVLDQFRGLRAEAHQPLDLRQTQAQKTIRFLAVIGVVTISLIAALTFAFPERGFQPPADYQKVAEIGLAQNPLQDQAVYRFTLDHPAQVSIFAGLDQIKGGPVQIRLTGPNGYENILLNLQDPKSEIGRASVHPQNMPLEKGDYEIRATLPSTPGQLRVYIKME